MLGELLNKAHIGDNVDFMKKLPDDCINLTVTSPPYDDLRRYNGYSFDFEKVANELFRITKPGGVVVWVVGDKTRNGSESLTSFKQALYFNSIGFNLHDTMIYEKVNPLPQNHKRYEQSFEYMFVLVKGKLSTFNAITEPCKKVGHKYDYSKRKSSSTNESGGAGRKRSEILVTKATKQKSNVWRYSVGQHKTTSDTFAFKHPAMFPEQLAHDHIVSWSNPGDIVFDCFAGAGTTLKMSKKNGRNFIGVELSAEYVDITNERLTKLESEVTV